MDKELQHINQENACTNVQNTSQYKYADLDSVALKVQTNTNSQTGTVSIDHAAASLSDSVVYKIYNKVRKLEQFLSLMHYYVFCCSINISVLFNLLCVSIMQPISRDSAVYKI